MIDFLAIPFCAVLMRIKGGGIIPTEHSKLSSACGFSVLVFGMTGNPLLATAGAIAWFIGCAPHIRNYLLALGGYKGSFEKRVGGGEPIIDKPLFFILERINLTDRNIRLVMGVFGTILRGMAMGIPMALAFQSWGMLLVGPAMAPCYFAGMSALQYAKAHGIKRAVYSKYFDGWSLGEWLWGGFIGVMVAWTL